MNKHFLPHPVFKNLRLDGVSFYFLSLLSVELWGSPLPPPRTPSIKSDTTHYMCLYGIIEENKQEL